MQRTAFYSTPNVFPVQLDTPDRYAIGLSKQPNSMRLAVSRPRTASQLDFGYQLVRRESCD